MLLVVRCVFEQLTTNNEQLMNPLSQATHLLESACSEHGILASTIEADNYRRVWSRDGIVAGIAGLLLDNSTIIDGLRRTLLTLSNWQHELGIIPSNVLVQKGGADVSHGSIAGRVDATCWYIVGACLFLKKRPNDGLRESLHENLKKALHCLRYWEFNAKGLLYLPTSGNWADEYPVKGHTLYDNLIRLWGLRLYREVFGEDEHSAFLPKIEEKIKVNFWPIPENKNHKAKYHPRLFDEAADEDLSHWLCHLAPEGFSRTFDAAGVGLALLLNIGEEWQTKRVCDYLEAVFSEIKTEMAPAFWPPIRGGDEDWPSIANNYSFDFKNHPHHFHNGGIWPVWSGLLGLGLAARGKAKFAERMLDAYLKIEDPENIHFFEYISSDELKPGGKKPLCYSASGLVFMAKATEENFEL